MIAFLTEHAVHQVCPASSDLFNLYGEFILLEGSPEGTGINGRVVVSTRYADDTTLLADSEGLQNLLDRTRAANARHGLEINPKEIQKCFHF